MNKIMCLDVGTKRIGIALSDYLHIIASPVKFILRTSDKDAIKEIKAIAQENRVETIIIGLPYNMDGTVGFQGENCIKFGDLLKNDFDVIYQDERLSSETAEENLRRRKIDFKKNKGLVDVESACVILQDYLDEKGAK